MVVLYRSLLIRSLSLSRFFYPVLRPFPTGAEEMTKGNPELLLSLYGKEKAIASRHFQSLLGTRKNRMMY